jgi:protocatechuate 3,4-dioxygenase beta subunit
MHRDDEHDAHDHDKGLSHDLPLMLSRRRALTMLGGAGILALAACADDTTSAAGTSSATAGTSSASGTTSSPDEIPEETSGPYPGDGSNGVNVLTESGIVRSDITKSFGSASGVATGVPLTIALKVLDVSSGGGPLQGAAVYVWHCDIDGDYSLYAETVAQENYLRGVQETAADGTVRFTSIYPAAYSGRWPHVHFEVYPSLAAATSASDRLRTSQLALPEAASKLVYATAGYEQSVANLARTSLGNDLVFSDGWSLQLARVSGTVTDGMTATLNVPV